MKMSDIAALATNGKDSRENTSIVIGMMAESLENTDNRLNNIENAIRDLAGKVGNQGAQLNETVATVATLKKDNTQLKEDVAILKSWDNNSEPIPPTKKTKNDGKLPSARKVIRE